MHRLERAFEAVGVPLLVLEPSGPDFVVSAVTDAAVELLGRPRQQLVGCPVSQSVPLPAGFIEAATGVLHTRQTVTLGPRHIHGAGAQWWWTDHIRPVADDADTVTCLVYTLEDVTGKVRLEQRDNCFKKAPFALVLTRGSACTIVEVNDAGVALFERERPELVGCRLQQLGLADDTGDLSCDTLVAQGPVRDLPCVWASPSGKRHVLSLSADRVDIGGELHMLTTIRDVTELSGLQQELARAQKLEAIGALASGVAHDFNNILMGISGMATLASECLESTSTAHIFLEDIHRATKRGAAISRQLMTFSQRDAPGPTEVFALDETLFEIREELAALLGPAITLTLRLGPESSWIRGDARQWEQVLVNLATNAKAAMPEGGQLLLTVTGSANGVTLTVSDTGQGMDEATRLHAFEPFFTTRAVGEGMGLGLSAVHGVVRRSSGIIEVDSTPGRGTTLHIRLPSATPAQASAAPPEAGQERASATILVVDDDPSLRWATKLHLEKDGHHVLQAADAAEAIACVEEYGRPIDLLLTEAVLPDASGAAVARVVQARAPGVPVLYMSGHDIGQLRLDGQIEPDASALQKPFSGDTLLAEVANAVAAARRIAPEQTTLGFTPPV